MFRLLRIIIIRIYIKENKKAILATAIYGLKSQALQYIVLKIYKNTAVKIK
jgi:hypothetical protein